MNFVFISPMFPKSYWNFCDRLKRRGVNVLSIGDTPYDWLAQELKDSLTDYYYVPNMEDYNEVYKAMAYLSFKYGKIDWLESNNEYWLEQDAKLRTDFHITTGMSYDTLMQTKTKSGMKAFYERAGIKTARYHLTTTLEEGKKFIAEVGYPVIVKPDNGVGAAATYKISNDEELEAFYNEEHITQYIMEEFVNGLITSFDGIANSKNEPLFMTSHVFPNPIMDVVNDASSMYYYSQKDLPDDLVKLGLAMVKEFPLASRCFHGEFFRLLEDHEGLGKKGDIVGLEVNMRMPGGYTPDMMNFANNIDVYDIYAQMVTEDKADYDHHRPYYCFYAGRRNGVDYKYTPAEIEAMYPGHIRMNEAMPDILSGAMGNYTITACFETYDEGMDFINNALGGK